ncbi:hypothetical protein EDC01DRAFT_788255 [Geopyxis carbonaria]|nr:hypothetical protein EDC01DRAFT_788255 [Geopyxis carbonaria]
MAIVAKVKSVLSGDTLVLKSTKSGAEKTLSLAYVSAPRLRREGDEPFAFQSRDALRKLAVGKEVTFTVLYNVASMNRDYGVVTLPDGQNLVEVVIQEGIAKLRDDAGKRDDQAINETLVEKLRIYESQARSSEKGVWSLEDDGRIECRNDSPSDAAGFLDDHKQKNIDAIVERVISGDRLAVRLLLEPKLHQQLVLLLAGIRAPLSQRIDTKGLIQPGEEYGEEAKEFIELRLLQRSVKVTLLGVSPQGQMIGTIGHPAGNIAEFLLVQGLARCADFHSTMLGPAMAILRAAEANAKQNKLRLWKQHVVKQKDSSNSFEATVSRVMNADTLFVRNKAGVEKKINLSSVRQPKPSDPSQSPFQAEAKEFLRKKLIGKHVRVNIDGKRPATDGFEEREMATVTFNNKNIALLLVESGYASVIRHRREDEDRSPIWDELSAAEEVARKEQKGMYAAKAPQTSKMVEASETMQKAKSYLSFLQRQKRVPAIVDFVSSGSRFKVIIPKENARLTFVLGGIRCPRTARNPSEESEPFGQEALDWSSRKCMQRDVEIDVEDIDRVGGFIGTMYINRESVAKGLVEEGFASVHAYSAEKSGHANELFAAENKAKSGKKGMWHDYDPSKESQEQYDAPTNGNKKEETYEQKKDYRDIVIANIEGNASKLKIQIVGTGTAALEELMSSFRNFHSLPANNKPIEGPPKVGEYVAAQFSEDGSWYRGRVRRVDRGAKEAEILYIDYGNVENVPWKKIRPLTQPQYSVQKLRGQAMDATLSFLQFPEQTDYAQDAIRELEHLTANKQLVANIDYTAPDGTLHLTLYDPNKSDRTEASLNAEIVYDGYARIPNKLKPFERAYPEMVSLLRKKQQEAEYDHRGIWEYGDPFGEDE